MHMPNNQYPGDPPLPRTFPSREVLQDRFAQMGWANALNFHQGQTIFDLLYGAARKCQSSSIVLDVSAGQCRYKPFFEHAQYIAIDNAAGDASWNYTCLDLLGDALELPIQSASVDVCLNFTSLEHYPDPHQAFREFARVLKPGGQLFLYVPFLQVEHQIPHDYFRYTRYGLAHLVQQSGMELIFLKPSNGIFETALDYLKIAIDAIPHPEAQQLLQQIAETQIKPILLAAENSTPDVFVDFPVHSTYPQLPHAYCLAAVRPGRLEASAAYPSRQALLQAVAACPVCKRALQWSPTELLCLQCHTGYSLQRGIPNLTRPQTKPAAFSGLFSSRMEPPAIQITGMRPVVTGAYISIHCNQCATEFESYQPTTAGIPIGRHFCPACHAIHEVWPETYLEALDRFLPSASFQEMTALTEEASRIAETWYLTPTLAGLLTYQDINLGEPTERELLSYITSGIYSQWAGSDRTAARE